MPGNGSARRPSFESGGRARVPLVGSKKSGFGPKNESRITVPHGRKWNHRPFRDSLMIQPTSRGSPGVHQPPERSRNPNRRIYDFSFGHKMRTVPSQMRTRSAVRGSKCQSTNPLHLPCVVCCVCFINSVFVLQLLHITTYNNKQLLI